MSSIKILIRPKYDFSQNLDEKTRNFISKLFAERSKLQNKYAWLFAKYSASRFNFIALKPYVLECTA